MRAAFPRFPNSYNRWNTPLERLAGKLAAQAWTEREGSHHSNRRHRPEGCTGPNGYAVRRWRDEGELFDCCSFSTYEAGPRPPQPGWDRHDLKGKRERLFPQLLSDLDMNHPPCLQLCAIRAFCTLAVLASTALHLLE